MTDEYQPEVEPAEYLKVRASLGMLDSSNGAGDVLMVANRWLHSRLTL